MNSDDLTPSTPVDALIDSTLFTGNQSLGKSFEESLKKSRWTEVEQGTEPSTSGIWSSSHTSTGSDSASQSSSSPPSSPSSSVMSPSSSSESFTITTCPPTPLKKTRSTVQEVDSKNEWDSTSFQLKLLFTSPAGSHSAQFPPPPVSEDDDHSLPPAFFPSARISFAPRLRITSSAGLPYSSLGGLHLGVTGMCETLDSEGNVKSKRMVADFCTDLSSGLRIWKRDAEAARAAMTHLAPQVPGEERLPAGTYVLPLSMKIPNSDRLPPSFECAQFRIHYTMSIALFSNAMSTNGTPRRLKVFSIPFHVLPSTLPTPPPQLPVLTHDHKKGVFASLVRSLSFTAPKADRGYHVVYPSLPTSHYSPASHASVPVSLRIVDRPLEPTDIYIRLAIIRKTYVRESSTNSMTAAIEEEWGAGAGTPGGNSNYPEEVIVEPWCKEEEEIVSRWGWVPYTSRPGADPNEKAEVIIQDIALPLSGLDGEGWQHGYSTGLDLDPTPMPTLQHGDCSWFSPAFRTRPPIIREYGKHIHVSSRFFLSIEVGFATPQLKEVLEAIGEASPDMEIPPPNGFTSPQRPSTSSISGLSLSNPFFISNARTKKTFNTPVTPTATLAFPGRLRELFIPLTIGSVAEPGMECIAASGESATRRAEREEREERGEDMRGENSPGESWILSPPTYNDAILVPPFCSY